MTQNYTSSIDTMRSVLYVPGDKERAVQKIPSLAADVIVLDLEDSVSPERRATARKGIAKALAHPANLGRPLVIRTNSVGTPAFTTDLQTVASTRPTAVLIPKYEDVSDLQSLRSSLRSMGLPRLSIWAMIETPLGIADIARLTDVNQAPDETYPLTTLVIGTNDISRLTGVRMDDGRRHMLSWLSSVLIQAKACGLRVLDGVYNDFSDIAGFTREAEQARAMGFDGKTLIHPSQIKPTHAAFAPTSEERAWAEKVIHAFALPENQGRGAINLDGRMVELLHLKIAQHLLLLS